MRNIMYKNTIKRRDLGRIAIENQRGNNIATHPPTVKKHKHYNLNSDHQTTISWSID